MEWDGNLIRGMRCENVLYAKHTSGVRGLIGQERDKGCDSPAGQEGAQNGLVKGSRSTRGSKIK